MRAPHEWQAARQQPSASNADDQHLTVIPHDGQLDRSPTIPAQETDHDFKSVVELNEIDGRRLVEAPAAGTSEKLSIKLVNSPSTAVPKYLRYASAPGFRTRTLQDAPTTSLAGSFPSHWYCSQPLFSSASTGRISSVCHGGRHELAHGSFSSSSLTDQNPPRTTGANHQAG